MIRDPSDGSVREKPSAVGIPTSKPMPGPDTGLRQPTRTDAQERMDRSREWLRQYHKPKDGEKADDLVHRSDESELPSEG
jgi:hypothetical protein